MAGGRVGVAELEAQATSKPTASRNVGRKPESDALELTR
jgi:hypothetical protein